MTSRTKVELAVCAIYFEEAPYLAEWIEFHHMLGVERFYLYDHQSTDGHEQVLRPYMEAGLVEVRPWAAELWQTDAYNDWLARHRDESRWTAFLDIDEFLFSADHLSLTEALRRFEAHPGVLVGRQEFTFSGHVTKPEGLVIENYTRVLPPRPGETNSFKCIVDPARTVKCMSAHSFVHQEGALPVDSQMQPRQPPYGPQSFPLTPLCLNHYYTKSAEEAYEKFTRVNAIGQQRKPPPRGYERRWEKRDQKRAHTDERILHYVPALRMALERRGTTPSPAP